MNIENLLKKLSDCQQQTKKQIIIKQPSKIKTSESFGTFNSITDHSDTSYVLQDHFTPHRKKPIYTNQSNLEEELSEIDKMKEVYQKRQKGQRSITKSIERSSAGRSSEKHTLKPSNTPSFNKVYKLPTKLKEKCDSAVKDIYQEEKIDYEEKKSSSHFLYPKSPQSLEDIIHNDPYEEESSLNFQEQKNESNDFKKEFRMTEKFIELEDEYPSRKEFMGKERCECEHQMRSFIEKTESRFEYTLNKIQQFEKDNKNLKEKFEKVNQMNKKYQNIIDQLLDDKERMEEDRRIVQQQKQQLQNILKDVLYKRQREKLQTSKENTHRDNEKKLKMDSDHKHHKSTESKMKVQNLLQKLQIKVDRA